MNLLKTIYCNQYFELKPKGKAASARKNGTILITVALVLCVIATYIFWLVFFPDAERTANRFFRKFFGRANGRGTGKLLALILLGISYLLIRYTIGTQRSYEETIQSFNKLSVDMQERISKKGLKVFIISIVLVGIAMASLLIKTYI